MRMQKSVSVRPKNSKSKKTTLEQIALGSGILAGLCTFIQFCYSEAGQAFFKSALHMIGIK